MYNKKLKYFSVLTTLSFYCILDAVAHSYWHGCDSHFMGTFFDHLLINEWNNCTACMLSDWRRRLPDLLYLKSRSYFSVQYCTLCVVLIEKCTVLNLKMCSIGIWSVLSSIDKSWWDEDITWSMQTKKNYAAWSQWLPGDMLYMMY